MARGAQVSLTLLHCQQVSKDKDDQPRPAQGRPGITALVAGYLVRRRASLEKGDRASSAADGR